MPDGNSKVWDTSWVTWNDMGTAANALAKLRPFTAEEREQQRAAARRQQRILWLFVVFLVCPPAGLMLLLARKIKVPWGLVGRLVCLSGLLATAAYFWMGAASELVRGRLIEVPVALLIAVAATFGAWKCAHRSAPARLAQHPGERSRVGSRR